jgi:ribosome maturation factor RimP
MAKRKVEDIVYEIAKPIIDRNNFELVEIEYKKKVLIGTSEYI